MLITCWWCGDFNTLDIIVYGIANVPRHLPLTEVQIKEVFIKCQRELEYTCNTIQYDTTRYDTIRYDTIQYNTIRDDTIRDETIQYKTRRHDTRRYNTKRYETMRDDTIQNETRRYDTIQNDTIRHDTRQYNTKRDETMQYKKIRYDTIFTQWQCLHKRHIVPELPSILMMILTSSLIVKYEVRKASVITISCESDM